MSSISKGDTVHWNTSQGRTTGTADLTLGDAVQELRDAGHAELADRIDRELVGRNVLPGRWTFQIVEGYDDTYYSVFKDLEAQARHQLVEGKRHLYEAEMKESERTQGHPAQTARPAPGPADQQARQAG